MERCASVVQPPLLTGKSSEGLFISLTSFSVSISALSVTGIVAKRFGVVKRVYRQVWIKHGH